MPPSRVRRRRSVWSLVLGLLLLLPPGMPRGQEGARLQAPAPARIRVELIQVFVTVVDRDGNPITDLNVDDFVLQENGKRMEIAVFDPPERIAGAPTLARPAPDPTASEAEPEAPSETLPAQVTTSARDGRTYVVVLDGYNNPSGIRFKNAKAAVIRFVESEQFQAGDRMAVFELRPQMRALCDLTDNKEKIVAAVNKAAFLPGSGNSGMLALIDGAITQDARISGDRAMERLENLSRFNAMLEESGQRSFYDNLAAIGDGMNLLAGRKYLLLFSGGFPLLRPTAQVYGYVDPMPSSLREMLNGMARSNTSIYTMNIGDETFGADVERSGNLRLSMAQVGMDENTLDYLGLDTIAYGDDPFYTKQSLGVLANQTGGRFVNDGNYDKALASIDRELLAAYTLGYYPTDVVDNGRFRKIKVKVKDRDAYNVQHRTGYFAPKPYDHMDDGERRLALSHAASGYIHREDLPVDSRVGFLPGEGGGTLATVTLEIPARYLELKSDGSASRYSLDVVMMAMDITGKVVDSVSKVVQAGVSAEPPPGSGLRLLESLTLPPGRGEIRFVVRDRERGSTTTRTESLEVPDFRYATLALSSLYVMNAASSYFLVDADFISADARRRLAREARRGQAPSQAPDSWNPFLLPDGSSFEPTSQPAFGPEQDLLVYVQVLNAGWSEEIGSPLMSVTFDLRDTATGSVVLPSRQEAVMVQGSAEAPTTVVYRLGVENVPAGEYDLRVTVLDKVANAAVQGTERVRVTASAPTSTDAAGR